MIKISAGESMTLIFPPMVNKTSSIRSLELKNAKVLDLKLLPELSLQTFQNLFKKTIKAFNNLTIVISDADILFPLGTPPFLFLQHLAEEHSKLSFIFLIHQNLLTESLCKRFFKIPVLFEKIIYMPLDPKKLPFKNKLQAKNFFLSLNENQRLILRLLVRSASEIPAQLIPDKEYLEKLKIVKKHYGRWKLISPLLEQAALETTKTMNEPLKLKDGHVYIGRQNITKQFSPSQQKIMILLLKAKGKIVNRDRIAKELWGKNYLEKYSDWAIDQLISKLRKKLLRLWINPGALVSKKKKGVFLYHQYPHPSYDD